MVFNTLRPRLDAVFGSGINSSARMRLNVTDLPWFGIQIHTRISFSQFTVGMILCSQGQIKYGLLWLIREHFWPKHPSSSPSPAPKSQTKLRQLPQNHHKPSPPLQKLKAPIPNFKPQYSKPQMPWERERRSERGVEPGLVMFNSWML